MMALCALVMVVSVRAFVAEYRVALQVNGTTNDFIDALSAAEGKEIQVFGARLARDLMVRCARTLNIAPRLLSDLELHSKVADSCRYSAEFIIINAPANPRALTVLLSAAARVDAALYGRAQAAAPFEPWNLYNRLKVVQRQPSLSASAAALVDADLGHALASDWGRRAVAGIYRDSTALRPAITAAAERLPPRDQAAFLDLLRHGVGGAG
ncbi:MAG: hypothetical protein RIR62_2308 [Pseudomonadota bacterium]|jgi:hypothetical protein